MVQSLSKLKALNVGNVGWAPVLINSKYPVKSLGSTTLALLASEDVQATTVIVNESVETVQSLAGEELVMQTLIFTVF